jgi:hypothetical protein
MKNFGKFACPARSRGYASRNDRQFDLSKPQPDTISARDYCDLVVHSFVFVALMNHDGSIEGFYITSDKLRGKGIWQFGLNTVIDLMKKTAKDCPAFARTIRDPETGETMGLGR